MARRRHAVVISIDTPTGRLEYYRSGGWIRAFLDGRAAGRPRDSGGVVISDRLAASNARTRRREVALLLAICLPFLLLGLGLDFLDPGEGLYGPIPSEMLACGDWILPHFNGLPYLEKPPLYFWLAAATLALGVSAEWTSRLWSALPALGSVLLTWWRGGRLYGPGAGLVAGIALSTSAGFALHVRRASPDLLIVCCITLALYGFVRDLDRPAGAASGSSTSALPSDCWPKASSAPPSPS